MDNNLTSEELNVLRVMRMSPNRVSFHELASGCGIKFDKFDAMIDLLIDKGYIRQDKRDERNGFKPGYTYFTEPSKRAEIDALLEKDFNDSVISINDIDCVNADLDDRTFICMHCKTAYKKNYGLCKNCLHGIVEIDTKILDIILELNRKGYPTKFSCSGHVSNLVSAAYIVMSDIVAIENIPEGFLKEDKDGRTIYRAQKLLKRLKKRATAVLDDEDIEKIRHFVNCDMDNLRKWVRQLPENKG